MFRQMQKNCCKYTIKVTCSSFLSEKFNISEIFKDNMHSCMVKIVMTLFFHISYRSIIKRQNGRYDQYSTFRSLIPCFRLTNHTDYSTIHPERIDRMHDTRGQFMQTITQLTDFDLHITDIQILIWYRTRSILFRSLSQTDSRTGIARYQIHGKL